MNLKNVKSLFKKELLDVLRDKKTVIMMVLVPIVLYPLLIVVSLQVMSKITTTMSEKTYTVAIESEDSGVISDLLAKYEFADYSLKFVETSEPEKALAGENIDVYIKISLENGKEKFEIYYISSITNSNYAADKVSKFLSDYSSDITKKTLEAAGLDADEILKPIEVSFKDKATNEETAGSLLSSILPFMLVVSLLMGTMYPAIDTTAGERERGTLETLLTLPVTNSEIIVSKFLVVGTIGIISALLNVISLIGVGIYMYSMASTYNSNISGGVDIAKFIPALLIVILCVFAFAVFISAITMCVTAFAKTYKEANNYITPLSLVVMFASFIGFIPNVRLTEKAALFPVANITLLIRDMLSFKYDAKVVLLVLLSNVLYGFFAIWILGRIYNSESILFGESAAGVQIFERRKNLKPGGVPELGDTILVLLVTIFAMIYIGGAIQLKYEYLGVFGTQLLILGIPVFAALYTKKDFKKTFRINKCKGSYFLAAAFMIIGAVLLGIVITSIIGIFLPESIDETYELQKSLMGDNFFSTLFIVAIVPAVCEEFMFRGYVLSALSDKFKPKAAMLIAACLFGIYHMSLVRFIVTAFLGYVSCYVVYKSKSIFTGSLMHFINNGLSVLILYYPNLVGKIFPVLTSETLDIVDLLFLIIIGILFMYLGNFIIKAPKGKKADFN